MNFYSLAADVIIFLHIIYVAFVLFGQFAILIGGILRKGWVYNPWFRGIHLCMTIVVAFEAVINYECPLTTLELEIRVKAGQLWPDYRQRAWEEREDLGFVGRAMRKLVLPADMIETLQWIFIGFGLLVLGCLIFIPPRHLGLIIVLNTATIGILYTCYLFNGRPEYWGHGDWKEQKLLCIWQTAPYVAAVFTAIFLRKAPIACVALAAIVLVQTAIAIYILRGAFPLDESQATIRNELGLIETMLPAVHVPGLIASAWLARRIGAHDVGGQSATPITESA